MRHYFAFTKELISCMKRLCNIPAGQVISNSAFLCLAAVRIRNSVKLSGLGFLLFFLREGGVIIRFSLIFFFIYKSIDDL